MIGTRSRLSRRLVAMLALAPICFIGALVAAPAEARENYALIAAVSDYPNLAEKYWLKGPKNDATLVRDYLLTSAPVPFKAENVVTLGSGEGLELATHDNILGQLAAIAAKAQPGDFVFLQFSGHGSYQPALEDALEQDGKDEIFLAADTMMAPSDNPKYMPNVITDNQFAEAFKAIRKAGAFVWLVFDSCHSGTITRGAPGEDGDGFVMREIKPADLGIDPAAFEEAAAETAERAAPLAAEVFAEPASENEGGLVAFFAAQSTETTPEKPYEVTLEDGSVVKQNYGVFTHTIFSALAKNPNMTYRQLAQSVLSGYAAGNMLKPTPLFEGQLDAPVFGSEDSVNVAQWPTVVGTDKSLTISAGQLHGLDRGTKLLVLPTPAAADEEALGIVEVASNDQLRSKLAGSTSDAFPEAMALDAVPAGAYVRLIEQSFPFELTVAKPDPNGDPAQLAEINAALDAILANDDKPLRLKIVEAGEAADVRLAVFSEVQVAELEASADRDAGLVATDAPADLDATPVLWLLPTSGEISLKPQKRSAAMDIGDSDAGDFASTLSQNLVTIFRATGLSRLSQANSFKPKDFKLSFAVQKAGAETLEALAPEATPIVRPDDRLYVDFANSSGKAVDLNVLYIDHDYGITLLCQAHLANGDKLFQPMADLNETDRGTERIVAVVNESGKDITDLSFLTQRGIVVRTRGAEDTSLVGMLADLGAGEPTRGPAAVASRDSKQPRGAVVMVPLEVLEATNDTPARDITPTDERQPVGSCAG
ncbi:MAG: caspase family protein [Hyphomicrobiales bacterium]|nr:MAG: caspase family protein [Hyphomicrobiales bacterium]